MGKKLISFVFVLSFAGTNPASTQDVNGFIDLFGSLAGAMNREAAARDWKQLSSDERKCIDRALVRKGLSVKSLIRGGIRPTDPRLSNIHDSCQADDAPSQEVENNVRPKQTDGRQLQPMEKGDESYREGLEESALRYCSVKLNNRYLIGVNQRCFAYYYQNGDLIIAERAEWVKNPDRKYDWQSETVLAGPDYRGVVFYVQRLSQVQQGKQSYWLGEAHWNRGGDSSASTLIGEIAIRECYTDQACLCGAYRLGEAEYEVTGATEDAQTFGFCISQYPAR